MERIREAFYFIQTPQIGSRSIQIGSFASHSSGTGENEKISYVDLYFLRSSSIAVCWRSFT